jgi:glycine cleavage system H protein
MVFPDNCRYTEDHEWLRLETDGTAYIGITDFAQSELGELVYVDVSTVGSTLAAHEIFGTVEAVKTTSDLFLPVAATILELNPDLDANPDYINSDPYEKGWIVKVKLSDAAAADTLMDAAAYKAFVGK